MSVLVDEKTRIVVTGATGRQGSFHLGQMLEFGTRVVAGVTPGRQGQEVSGVPVYDTVETAVEKHGANAAVVFVPGTLAKDSVMECIDAGVPLVVVVSEHVPLHDAMVINAFAAERGAMIVGPNTYGLCAPSARCKIGIPPNSIFQPGPVGVVARSGTLSYELVGSLTDAGLGQTTVVGMGGDRAVGLNFVEVLKLMEADPETKAIVLVGEIGGSAEEEAAAYIQSMKTKKPVVAFIAGRSAPPGKRMGHAGAIIERGMGTYDSKVKALRAAGVAVADFPWQVAELVKERIG